MSSFDYSGIPEGYYQDVVESGHPVRRAWHLQKFERVIECLPRHPGQALLDIGCFAGTFLSLLDETWFSRQVGVDILAKQIEYAQRRFGTAQRRFVYTPNIDALQLNGERFDVITVIEVIEHLRADEIRALIEQAIGLLVPGGKLVLSTPNYTSIWPLLEVVVNRVSDVSYEEQHITKFNSFNAHRKLCRIAPELAKGMELDFKTTTHFIAPFLAPLGLEFSMRLSRLVPHQHWGNPFGNLVLMRYTKR
jgi:2-polyprenyl-3-methyl-5-hydroxy-6-metoxy-1,4-benzoquinol methylase